MYYIGDLRDGVDLSTPYATYDDAKDSYEELVINALLPQIEMIQLMLEHRNWEAEPADPDYHWLRMAHDAPSRIDEAAEGMIRAFFYITDADFNDNDNNSPY